MKQITKPNGVTLRAMWLRSAYLNTGKYPSLSKLLAMEQYARWWGEMDNRNRTYVLKGR